jgi:hypothetical protein
MMSKMMSSLYCSPHPTLFPKGISCSAVWGHTLTHTRKRSGDHQQLKYSQTAPSLLGTNCPAHGLTVLAPVRHSFERKGTSVQADPNGLVLLPYALLDAIFGEKSSGCAFLAGGKHDCSQFPRRPFT